MRASWLIVAGCVFGLGLAAGQAQERTKAKPGVVEATRFVLVDADGDTRAELSTEAAGAGLLFYDPKGRNTIQILSPAEGGSVLKVLDADGKTRVTLGVTPDGDAAVAVSRGNDVSLVSSHAGDCGVLLRGKDGKVKGGMSLDARGRFQK